GAHMADLSLEKAAEVSWEEEAEHSGASHNILVEVQDDGTMKIKDEERDDTLGGGGSGGGGSGVLWDTPSPGIYRILQRGLLGRSQVGVGVFQEGVFHTMWHVTRGAVLMYQGKRLEPSWASVKKDLISYGGGWRFQGSWNAGEEVQVIAVEPGKNPKNVQTAPGTFKTPEGEVGAIALDFKPGTSGSPIVNREGKIVGLYGNGVVTTSGTYVSAIAQAKASQEGPLPEIEDEVFRK
uniref:fusion protein of nonstructural protein 2B and nonstructural protein 3 n=1 Tax=Dengue virus type 1 (strain Nauru/West Pac/1974) TaxID=11059 RepID=UPI0001C59225|nr:Chain A, fusion protein of nonstructural protein 2B and nonstructural protein 3 [synthetic construct]